jgi:hypothetical protein
MLSVENYVSGYAYQGNQPTGAVVDLFNDLVNCADEFTGATAKSICTKLLMQTAKMDHKQNHKRIPYLFHLFVNIYPRQYFL